MSLLAFRLQALSRFVLVCRLNFLDIPELPLTSWEPAGSHKPAGDTCLYGGGKVSAYITHCLISKNSSNSLYKRLEAGAERKVLP